MSDESTTNAQWWQTYNAALPALITRELELCNRLDRNQDDEADEHDTEALQTAALLAADVAELAHGYVPASFKLYESPAAVLSIEYSGDELAR